MNRWYTVAELAELWRVKEGTIHVWMYRMRQADRHPHPGQVKTVRLNAARRWLEIRQDYAATIEAIFKAHTMRL